MKKAAAGLLLAVVVLRAAVFWSGEDPKQALAALLDGDRLVSAALTLELGQPGSKETEEPAAAASEGVLPVMPTPIPAAAPTADPTPEVTPSPAPTSADALARAVEAAGTIGLTNRTDYSVDTGALAARAAEVTLDSSGPQILILHTHSTEAYTPDGVDTYEASDPFRTLDETENVLRVGDVLAEALESCGLGVLHDRGLYDYPSYTGSYGRAAEAIQAWLAAWPSLSVVIDLHRDAIESGGIVYKTQAELNGVSCAQVMLVVGTDAGGLDHPNWRQNLGLAALLQGAADAEHPTLMRDLELVRERYNAQLCPGAFILEVGSSGNTLAEAIAAVRLFGQAVGPVLARQLV